MFILYIHTLSNHFQQTVKVVVSNENQREIWLHHVSPSNILIDLNTFCSVVTLTVTCLVYFCTCCNWSHYWLISNFAQKKFAANFDYETLHLQTYKLILNLCFLCMLLLLVNSKQKTTKINKIDCWHLTHSESQDQTSQKVKKNISYYWFILIRQYNMCATFYSFSENNISKNEQIVL